MPARTDLARRRTVRRPRARRVLRQSAAQPCFGARTAIPCPAGIVATGRSSADRSNGEHHLYLLVNSQSEDCCLYSWALRPWCAVPRVTLDPERPYLECEVMRPMSRVLMPVLAFVALVALGCPKKAPKTAPASEPIAAPVEIAPRPASPTESDAVASPLDSDLAAANLYAQQQGLLADVYFDFDKAELRERGARAPGEERPVPRRAQGVPGDDRGPLRRTGHRASTTSPWGRAGRRWRATTSASLGIAPERIVVISLGEERPVCAQSEESCWQQNRRVHFVLSGRM